MNYVTVKQYRKPRQLTWEDVFMDRVSMYDFGTDVSNSTGTITRTYETISDEVKDTVDVNSLINWLKRFNKEHSDLFEADRKSLYHSFKIPKATGGFRQIDAPCEELQSALSSLSLFLTDCCGVLYHTSAFAYVKGRCIVDCLKKHQRNESNWFLKTDFSGFFPNTTIDFVMNMMEMIFPVSLICENREGKNELEKALSLGFLNGGLPQGTTLSPTLTNIMMIPIDYTLFNELAHRKMVYTRYADDIHISAFERFPYKEIVSLVEETLKKFGAPFVIKEEKTHFGNRKGKNWCLGLMLNAENNISVGYRNKKYFKAALCSFILDTKNGKAWDIEDVMHLRGQLSYYTMVEKEYFNKIIDQQNKKWNVNVYEMFREYLSGKIA